jgi:hypothetical protein
VIHIGQTPTAEMINAYLHQLDNDWRFVSAMVVSMILLINEPFYDIALHILFIISIN